MKRLGTLLLAVLVICGHDVNARDSLSAKPKSKGTALALSLGATLAPAAVGAAIFRVGGEKKLDPGHTRGDELLGDKLLLIGSFVCASGLILGPGVGHAYAGKRHPFARAVARGALLPTALGLAAVAGFANVSADVAWTLLVVGVAAGTGCLFLCVYDIATVGRSVDAYNRKHGFPTTSVAPYYRPDNSTLGLQASLRF
ncbi:MAG TPA: hypothetical protein VN285_02055 [Candidatus Deferrimicrobium sp.]|nr:hypothetical protein [Candidatus Deferrimicrobium sp.]